MADATTAKTEKKAPKTSATPSAQTSGSKTLFVGNLSYSVERAGVEEVFKGAGEVVDARFTSNEEGVFKGFGHVEFATEAAAHKIHFAEHINVCESSSSFQIQNRFGKLLFVPIPDDNGRGLILKAHARKNPLAADVDLDAIGRSKACENLSGADLAA